MSNLEFKFENVIKFTYLYTINNFFFFVLIEQRRVT